MRLERIITMASEKVKTSFVAMERSLRRTGCDLPLEVIPYNDERFALPENAAWSDEPAFFEWIDRVGNRPVMRKYLALTRSNFLFVDSDVIFLKDPAEALAGYQNFVTSCLHWSNPGHTLTKESHEILRAKTSLWPRLIFNTGQFASEKQLYDLESLIQRGEDPAYRSTVLDNPFHEQPGIVLLVNLSGCPITNMTLPPWNMESTWAGDYRGFNDLPDFVSSRSEECPFLIHWAGCSYEETIPFNSMVKGFLSNEEWEQICRERPLRKLSKWRRIKLHLRNIVEILRG